jgi:chromosome segregation ATPase
VEKASEMLDSSCVHHVAARVPHEAQQVYDSLCGQCDIFDHHANQARLNADSRVCERIVWRRVRSSESAAKSTLELLAATQGHLTQSQADLRHTTDELHRAHVQLREAHNLVHSAHEQLREAHNQVSDAHYRLREAYEQLRVAHDQARNLSQELRETYEQLHGSQTHNAQLMESIRQTNQALEQSNLEVHDLRQQLGKFEDHPVLGVALKGRRRLRRALHTLRSAG